MIRSLRRRHRFAALGLALLLPPAYGIALAARAPAPRVAGLAASLGEPAPARIADRIRLPARADGAHALAVGFGRDADGAPVVELDTRGTSALPDALVYFSARAPAPGDGALPAKSWFLGALPESGVRSYRLPDAARPGRGAVVVWSLAWQEIVLAAELAPEGAP